MKNLKILAFLTLLFLLAISSVSGILAQTRSPGVTVGDSYKYTYSLNLTMSDSDFLLPTLFEQLTQEAKAIDWTQITITSISGSSVTAQILTQFKNGTQQSGTGVTDVATGDGNLTMFLISANLNPQDQIFSGNSADVINETITITYPSTERQVNHQEITMHYDVTQEELSGFNITGPLQQTNTQNIYWDKQTGSLVEMSYNMTTRSEQINADISVKVKLIESNVYTVPEFPAMIMVIAIVVLTTMVVAKFRSKLRARPAPSFYNY